MSPFIFVYAFFKKTDFCGTFNVNVIMLKQSDAPNAEVPPVDKPVSNSKKTDTKGNGIPFVPSCLFVHFINVHSFFLKNRIQRFDFSENNKPICSSDEDLGLSKFC